MGPGVVLGSLGLHSFVQAGLYNYKDQAYSLKYEPFDLFWGCKWSTAVSRTQQHYLNSPNLDGNYDHLRLEAGCRPAAAPRLVAPAETIFGLTTGRDNPIRTDRPGGVKTRLEFYARHERALTLPYTSRTGTATLWGRLSRSHDELVYSSLLGTDPSRTRSMQRHSCQSQTTS